MKRILAGFLTLAMVLNIAPVGAFAASDSDAASIQAVAETEQSPSSALDEETARAIASDPFLQGADSAPVEQEQQAEVDTSNVSMTATNSFGQLLVNGMETQSSTSDAYTDHITKVTMNGHTANVEFVLDGTADLVVAIYTDSDAEEMVASGTETVNGSGNETAKVTISGDIDIPETYTVKAFLLDTTEHAPLSAVYTDVSHTQGMVDLDNATVDDFPADRVINLDGQNDTNFGALKEDVARVKSNGNTNVLVSADDTAKVYTFGYATESLKNLQQGDILYYEKDDEGLAVVKVEQIHIEGSTVTIQGSQDLEVTEVFEALKIDADMKTDDFEVRGTADDAMYLGEYAMDPSAFALDSELDLSELAQTNKSGDYPIDEVSKKFSFESKEKVDGLDDGSEAYAKVSGELNLSVTGTFKYNIANGQQYAHFEVLPKATMTAEIKGEVKTTIEVPPLDACPIVGVFIGLDPKINFDAKVVMTLTATANATLGFEYNKIGSAEGTFQNLCTEPIFTVIPTAEGQIYIGFDFGPSVAAFGGGDWYMIRARLITEIGLRATLKAKSSGLESGHTEKVRHGCGLCYEGNLDLMIKVEATLTFLENEDLEIGPKSLVNKTIPIATAYASPVYGDFGWGKCPHDKYRVHITVETKTNPTGAAIYMYTGGIGESEEIAKLQLASKTNQTYTGEAYFYLDPGSYTFKTTVGNKLYTSKPVLIGTTAVDIELEEDFVGPVKPDPDETVVASGTCGDDLTWKLNDEGTLTISGTGAVYNYTNAPWYSQRTAIKKVVFQSGVTGIGNFAFYDCSNLTDVVIPESVMRIGESAFENCASLLKATIPSGVTSMEKRVFYGCSSLSSMVIPEGVTTIEHSAFDKCSGLRSVVIPEGVTHIGPGAFYGCKMLTSIKIPESAVDIENDVFHGCTKLEYVGLPEKLTSISKETFWDCSKLTRITIPSGVTSIGYMAFRGCNSLKNVDYVNTKSQWKKISIDSWNDAIYTATICCTDGKIKGNGEELDDEDGKIMASGDCGENGDNVKWKLYENGHLIISGSGAMIEYAYLDACPWYSYVKEIKKVTIQSGVTSIVWGAFENCSNLTSVTIPEGITRIGNYAFSGCGNLANIEIPKSAISIGSFVFSGCRSLTSVVIPEGVTSMKGTFEGCESLTNVVLPEGLRSIEPWVFSDCESLTNITYRGTMAQWKSIKIYGNGNYWLLKNTIHCTDGDIAPDTENSISTGTTAPTTTGSKFAATFSNVEAGKDYVVIVSRSGSDPLNADNLLYINQIKAEADGELVVPFTTEADASEMQYTVACARENVDPDQPADPGDKPSSGGGDDGMMAAVLLVGGVVAVAAVTGVVLMMPVDVQGTVKLAGQPVANAAVQVLQGDSVAAQTTTNADGWFAVKVRRGNYTLRVTWTDAQGQPVTRTQDFKAPDKSLSIAA